MDKTLTDIVQIFFDRDGLRSARFVKKASNKKKKRWCFVVLHSPQEYAREEVELAQAYLSTNSTTNPKKTNREKEKLRKEKKRMRKNRKANR